MTEAHHDLAKEAGVAVAKVIPPVAIWSLTLNDWLAAVSIIYVLAQLAYLGWRWRRDLRSKRDA